MLAPFGLTQALGIYAAWRFLPQAAAVAPVGWGSFSWLDLIILAAVILVFVLVTTRFRRVGSVFFKIFLSLLIFSGVETIAGIWLEPIASALLAVALVVVFWRFQNVIIQNIAMILTIAAIGAIIGLSFASLTVIYILVIFSFYDIISVYKTGHMIKLAQAMIESRAIFGFVIPEPGHGLRSKISGVATGQGFMILGSGDVIFPLLLSASLIRVSLLQAGVVAIFSALGLFLMHLIFSNQQTRRPMAALPPIALMTILGYLITVLI